MKAIRIQRYGAPAELVLAELAPPAYGEQDLLIKVIAAGVNPIDWKIRSGQLAQRMPRALPFVPGWECAGVVEAVGSAVTGFRPGDAVYTYAAIARGGGYAEYVAVAADEVAPAPRSLSPSVAASLPMTAQTACTLIEAAALQAGQRLLIHGGSGGVGALAIQLAKRQGAEVITTVSAGSLDFAHSLGADAALDYRRPELLQQLAKVDLVIDTVGGAAQDASWPLLKAGGRLLSIAQPPAAERAQAAQVQASFVSTPPRGALLRDIARLFDDGALKPLTCHEYPLADAARVHAQGEAGQLRGRTVLRVAD